MGAAIGLGNARRRYKIDTFTGIYEERELEVVELMFSFSSIFQFHICTDHQSFKGKSFSFHFNDPLLKCLSNRKTTYRNA